MLRTKITKITKIISFSSKITSFRNNAEIYSISVPKFNFSENKKEPDGFEKFKQRNKKEKIEKSNKEENLLNKANIDKLNNDEKIKNETKLNNNKNEEEIQSENQANEGKSTEENKNINDKQNEEKKNEQTFNQNEKEKNQSNQNDPKFTNNKKKKSEQKYEEISEIISFLKSKKMYVFGVLFFTYLFVNAESEDKKPLTIEDFINNYVKQNKVLNIKIRYSKGEKGGKCKVIINLIDGRSVFMDITNLDLFLKEIEAAQPVKIIFFIYFICKNKNKLIPITFDTNITDEYFMSRLFMIASVSIGILILLLYLTDIRILPRNSLGGGRDIFSFGNANVKIFGIDVNVKVKFNDVAGLKEAKTEISEFVDFLKKPQKYVEIGAKLPRGALLTGPPGTGKTMLAKACAGEAGVPFFYISGSDFVEMFVGVGAARVRDLFKQAKSKAPAIIFIDEIDAVGKKRDSKMGRSNDERDNTLNQLLVEMDGFGTDNQVIVLAATNRKELLDPALTRPGRFDRSIEVSLPDIEGRYQIFLVHLTPLKLSPSQPKEEYAKRLSTLTPGFSGADIANLCNEAAILAARNNKPYVETINFELASERIIAGLEKKSLISQEERKTVAVHESGHAVVGWFSEGGAPLLKLTIIPRSKGSLGFAQYLPNESSLYTKEELLDQICCVLGGRCAEELFFEKITTGAANDIEKAYEIAYAIITKYGMSEKIGFVGFEEDQYKKSFSDQTQNLIDLEIRKIINDCTERTRNLIKRYREKIQNLSDALLQKETLDLKNIVEILGERPFKTKSNFKAYLETKKEIDIDIEKDKKQEEELKKDEGNISEEIKTTEKEEIDNKK